MSKPKEPAKKPLTRPQGGGSYRRDPGTGELTQVEGPGLAAADDTPPPAPAEQQAVPPAAEQKEG